MPRLNIIVSGMIARVPGQGGAVWAVLQYLLGLRLLGHKVHFIEPVPGNALVPPDATFENSDNAAYFRRVVDSFSLEQAATLMNMETKETIGLRYCDLLELTQCCDVLINISGLLEDEELTGHIPIRVYLDLDPAFTQLWSEVQGIDVGFNGHSHFATIGMALGQSECPIPTCGLTWIKTVQPIVLSHWPVVREIAFDSLTTIANWRGYGSIQHEEVYYGQKAHSLRPFFSLPKQTKERFVLALAIHRDENSDLQQLARNGWKLLDPGTVADTPENFQRFIQGSKAEFGFAKSGYVMARCGWFSDRSICYLASGRPVIAQDTGFSNFLPTGKGLFAFETIEDVLSSIDELNRDYKLHAAAAREIAEEYFESGSILTRLLQGVGAA